MQHHCAGKGRALFREALDPRLITAPIDGKASSISSRDKGKARADGNGVVLEDVRARKPFSRINSLMMSVDSPEPQKQQRAQVSVSNGEIGITSASASATTSHSTIESFGSRSEVQGEGTLTRTLQEKQRSIQTTLAAVRVKRTRDDFERRTSHGRKRRKLEREAKRAARQATSVSSERIELASSFVVADISEAADEAWDRIWDHWNVQELPPTAQLAHDQGAIHYAAKDRTTNAIAKEVEKKIAAAQSSQLSAHSEDGAIELEMSFHRLHQSDSLQSSTSVQENRDIHQGESELSPLAESSRSDADLSTYTRQRLQAITKQAETELHSIRCTLFQGKAIDTYFTPAWDGFRLLQSPPSRGDLARWSEQFVSEGGLYDYGDDLDSIVPWDEQV